MYFEALVLVTMLGAILKDAFIRRERAIGAPRTNPHESTLMAAELIGMISLELEMNQFPGSDWSYRERLKTFG